MTKDDLLSEKEAIALLRKHSKGDDLAFTKVYEHSLAVKNLAMELVEKIKRGVKIDKHLVLIGSLLHDIGRFEAPPGKESIKHGIIGAKILRKEGLEKCARISERHIGIGIKKQDVLKQELPLPLKDYLPETNEEKLICYADNRIAGTKVMDEEYVVERFTENLGKEFEQRTIRFHEEVSEMFEKR